MTMDLSSILLWKHQDLRILPLHLLRPQQVLEDEDIKCCALDFMQFSDRNVVFWSQYRKPWQCFLKFHVHTNHLGLLSKCRFRFGRSSVGPEILHFTKHPRFADAFGLGLQLGSKSLGDLEGSGEKLNISKNAFNLVLVTWMICNWSNVLQND